jgi:hypothetical protein
VSNLFDDRKDAQSASTGLQHWLEKKRKPEGMENHAGASNLESKPSADESTDNIPEKNITDSLFRDTDVIGADEDICGVENIEFGIENGPEFEEIGDSGPGLTTETFTQIELPPMSQIHMSQVEELPLCIQNQIKARMEAVSSEKETGIRYENNGGACLTKSSDDRRKRSHSDINHRRLSHSDSSHRYRQTDLKRMFKLAAVQAGQETTDVSLTQLECLPLETKLQVVNNDNQKVGTLTKSASSVVSSRLKGTNAYKRDQRSRKSDSEWSPSKGRKVASSKREAEIGNASTNSSSGQSSKMTKPSQKTKKTIKFLPLKKVISFYDDILPLKSFLDMNNPSIDDAFEMVISFLKIVLKERPASIVAILRSIRRRYDGWSSDAVLKKIVLSIDDHHYKIYESRIDFDWIFGRKYEVDDENGNDDEHDTDDEELETDTSSNEEEEDTYEEEET